jgi:PEP-CTERM motif
VSFRNRATLDLGVDGDPVRWQALGMKYLPILLLVAAPLARSAVLDYPVQAPPVTDGGQIAASYGDVAGLVDVTHEYINTAGNVNGGLLWYSTGYDDLVGVAWNGSSSGGDFGRVTLASVGGSVVELTSFDLGIWSSGRGVPETVTVTEIGNPTPVATFNFQENANQHWTFQIGASSTSGFVIQWTSPWWVAIDNVVSSAAPIPEPATALTLLGGLALLAAARRRRA